MKVEFLIPWRYFPGGQVLEMADGMANELLRRGICRLADTGVAPREDERAKVGEPATVKRGPGRPRKYA